MSWSPPDPAGGPPRESNRDPGPTAYLIAPTVGWMLVRITGIQPSRVRTPASSQDRRRVEPS
jgi:hypothetical protein